MECGNLEASCQMLLAGEVKWGFTVIRFSNVEITEIDFQI